MKSQISGNGIALEFVEESAGFGKKKTAVLVRRGTTVTKVANCVSEETASLLYNALEKMFNVNYN